MKLLREIKHTDLFTEATGKDARAFAHRQAARAIVSNTDGAIALLYVGKYKYHKLPGGGIENGEAIAEALEREIAEEIGCQATVTHELGKIVEYRDEWDQVQTSYCYLARQKGEQHTPDFTDDELANGFAVVWASDLTAAIALLEADHPEDYGGKFIVARDLTFLHAAHQINRTV